MTKSIPPASPPPFFAERPHALVVDDDARIRDLLVRFLTQKEWVVVGVSSAREADQILETLAFDIAVVDIMMPDEDGLSLTKRLRSVHQLPVLLLTARGEAADRIDGLSIGADDYLVKPFEPEELALRLSAILRRRPVTVATPVQIQLGPRTIDLERGLLTHTDGSVQKLTAADSALLKALVRARGNPMDRRDLARACGIDSHDRTIDVQVARLRRKIEDDTKTPYYLQTLRGQGYVLQLDDHAGEERRP